MDRIGVLFLSPVGFFKGGAERSLFDLTSNEGIRTVLAAPEDGPVLAKGRDLGYPCHVVDFAEINSIHRPFSFMDGIAAMRALFRAAYDLKKLGLEHDCKIVHSNGLKAHAINCVSRWIGGPKAVIHIRDIPYTAPEKLVWHIFRLLANDMVLVSRACWPGASLPSNVHVIHNGTPLRPVHEKSGYTGALQLGFVGRIHPAKGLHLLIDWMADARRKGLDLFLTVRGQYSDDAPTYESEITAQIERAGLTHHIKFDGFVDSPEKVYEGLDVVVVPSKTADPLPRSVMEAMACGIPVLGYPEGGIVEMIDDYKTGFLVKDSHSFIAAIENLQSDPAKLATMVQNARTKIQQDFTIENLHARMNEIYRRLAK